MSTLGREADEAWERKLLYERSLTDKRIRLFHAIRFAVGTLEDTSVADADARSMVLRVLRRWLNEELVADDLDQHTIGAAA
jgi:hypothetical protein